MASKKRSFLKTKNRDFNNVLDSIYDSSFAQRSGNIFQWNYTKCGAPIATISGLGDGNGVIAASTPMGILFPGPNGELYPSTLTNVEATTTKIMYPQMEGAIPAADAGATAVGYNLQLDGEAVDNGGFEWVPGNGVNANASNKFVVGTNSGYFDATFWTSDWTDYDCVAIGFRIAGVAFETGHAAILAAASGDPLYTDFVAFGVQSADDIQIATALNDGDRTYTDSTQVPTDSDNLRLRVDLSSAGVVTYSHVSNAIAGAGTLAAPTTTAAYTFDDGDTLIPYMVALKNGTADVELLVKDIVINRQGDYQWEELSRS